MGHCFSSNSSTRATAEVNESLAHKKTQNKKKEDETPPVPKLLLLGTGHSGKSTIFHAMKRIYRTDDPNTNTRCINREIPEKWHSYHLTYMRRTLVYSMRELLQHAQDLYDWDPIHNADCLVNKQNHHVLYVYVMTCTCNCVVVAICTGHLSTSLRNFESLRKMEPMQNALN